MSDREKGTGPGQPEDPVFENRCMTAMVPEFEEPSLDMLEEAAHWIERLAGPHDVEERAAFEGWLAARPAHEFAYAEMLALRDAVGSAAQAAAAREASRPRRRRTMRWLGGLAASVAIVGLGSSWLPELALRMRADAVTARGETQQVRLPDGSRVALNSASAIEVRYSADRRDVRLLKGEAFFDVARNPDRPFAVAAGNARVHVLGTHFNVRLDGVRTTLTVEEGQVRFGAAGHPRGQLIFTAGQQAFVEGTAAQRQPVYDASAAFAWRNGQIVFYRAPLREVVAEIDRYRSGEAFILNSGLGRRTVSGSFSARTPDLALAATVNAVGARMIRLPGGIAIIFD